MAVDETCCKSPSIVAANAVMSDLHIDSPKNVPVAPAAPFGIDVRMIALAGKTLAKTVDRSLWRNPNLPPIQAEMTDEQGMKIYQEALEKVQAIWGLLSADEKRKFNGHSMEEISSTPSLFNEILFLADEIDLAQLLQKSLVLDRKKNREEKDVMGPAKLLQKTLILRDPSVPSLASAPSYLELSPKELTGLLHSAVNLTHLTCLHLAKKGLTDLPKAFGNLIGLQWLQLADNQLTTLRDSFTKLRGLDSLYLDNNQLTLLPESFGNLSGLMYLRLDRNHLKKLPDSFGNLSALIFLWLYQNQLESLPESFRMLRSLKHLFLGRNNIGSLPAWFGELSSLSTLFLEGNQLLTLHESFRNLSSLTTLSLGHNRLLTLPDWVEDLPSLKSLSITENPLQVEPRLCSMLARLREMGCEICCDQDVEEGIREVSDEREARPSKVQETLV